MANDVRSIANFVLDSAERQGIGLSNMAINKIVYFLHAHCLVELDEPLVTAKIEAWEHGPIFRELYREFRVFADRPIQRRATRADPILGKTVEAQDEIPERFSLVINKYLEIYLRLSASALRALSHEPGGPWDKIWNHDKISSASMRISDSDIRAWFNSTARH